MKKNDNSTPRDSGLPKLLGSRKLVLHKETLRNLEAGELRQVAAGGPSRGYGCALSHPVQACGSLETC